MSTEELQIAENIEQADAPCDRRQRQVVPFHAQVMKPRNTATAAVSTTPMTRLSHGEIAGKSSERYAVV